MRDPRYRSKVKKLFVLGAGASLSATSGLGKRPSATAPSSIAPLDKDFCARIASLDYYQRPPWVKGAVDRVRNSWIEHSNFKERALEEAIIRQLSHMEFFDRINRRRRLSSTQAEYLNDLAHLITFTLKKCRETNDFLYRKLATKIFPLGEPTDGEEISRIITFNYDDFLDNHLLLRFTPQRTYFDSIKRNSDDSNYGRKKYKNPLLIKLHGSVNWRCKTNEFEKILNHKDIKEDSYRIENIWYTQAPCPSPEIDVSPCIVPPIPDKPMTRISLFKYLWTRACEYLHGVEHLVICGYSLPDTDTLAMSLFGNLKNRRLKSVTVVDPNPAILQRWRSLLITPANSNAQWVYHSDFREYLKTL